MSEQAKAELSCGEYGRGVPWYPLRKWWQPSRFFSPDVGLPPSLEPWDPRWMDEARLQRSLAACSWPGYMPTPLFVPYISGSMRLPEQEISKKQYKWTVSLDVSHFSPEEVSLSVRGRFLEVGGRHEERPDEHGFIARCFTRKYRLPAEIDVTEITSSLSVDGILTVEAPVPETSVPAAIIIPIKLEMEVTGEKREEAETPDGDDSRAPVDPDSPCAEGDDGEESPLEVHGDHQAHPGSTTAGLQQHEERREQEEKEEEEEEETHEKPAGESHPSAPADGKGTESFQDSSEHQETSESQESPDTDASKQPEHTEPAADGEIPVMAGTGEGAQEITRPEEPELGMSPQSEVASQELEALDIKQEHTE